MTAVFAFKKRNGKNKNPADSFELRDFYLS